MPTLKVAYNDHSRCRKTGFGPEFPLSLPVCVMRHKQTELFMKLSQFKFDLPLNLIAQHPTKKREDARMMVVHRYTGQIENKHFRDILDYFDDKDVFVVNNTKVFPARMYGRKEKTGAKIEVFLLRELNKPNRLWDVIVDPARKIRVGNKLYFGDTEELVAEVIDNTTSRGRTIRFLWESSEEEFRATPWKN